MKAVLLNDKQRNKIIRAVKLSKRDFFSYQNLNLLTAVYDEEKNIYLTLSHYMSPAITRSGENCEEYSFVMLTPLGCFTVRCTNRAGKYSGIFSPLPVLVSGQKIQEMIRYYDDSFSERRLLEKEAKSKVDTGEKSFTEWYLEKHFFETGKRSDLKIFSRISFGLAALSLIIGASFHGYRVHPENTENYDIGVTMGIAMISAFVIFLLAGIVLTFLRKRK